MKPVRTARSNFVYTGPPGVRDLHCERREGMVLSVWQFTAEERRLIAGGANVELTVLFEPIPPMALTLTDAEGIGEDSPAVLERAEFYARAMRS